MSTNRIANIIYNMSLDMDYADYLEYYKDEIEKITIELELLHLQGSSLFYAMENIALQNEEMEDWAIKREGN